MIPIWQGAEKVVMAYGAVNYVACLFPDRVCVYTEEGIPTLWFPGTFIDIAFFEITLILIDSTGQDYAYAVTNFSGIKNVEVASHSFSVSLGIVIREVHSCRKGDLGFGIALIYNESSNLTGPRLSLFSNETEYDSGDDTYFYVSSAGRYKEGYFNYDSFFTCNGLASSYNYPTMVERVGFTVPIPEYSVYFYRHWGASYTHVIDASNFGVSYWDGLVFNTTTFSTSGRKNQVLDGTHFILVTTTDYSLFEYDDVDGLFKEVATFNPADNALPSDQNRLVLNYDCSVLLGTAPRNFYIIDLTDGSYVSSSHPNSSRDIDYYSKRAYDPGTGYDKLFYYIKSPFDKVRVFNITQQIYYSVDVTTFLAPFEAIVNEQLTGGDYVISLDARAVEPFSEGIVVFAYAILYYGGELPIGAIRLLVNPSDGSLTFLDSDIDFLGSDLPIAASILYENPTGVGRASSANSRNGRCFENPPPFVATGGISSITSTFHVAVADQTDLSKSIIFSAFEAESEEYKLSGYEFGLTLSNPEVIIDAVVLRDYIIFAVVKDGNTWLVLFSLEFYWGDNSLVSRGGVLENNLVRKFDIGEVALTGLTRPFSKQLSEPVSSLTAIGDMSVSIKYVTGKSIVMAIGDFLE